MQSACLYSPQNDVPNTFSFFADDAHLDNLRKSTRNISQIIDQSFSNAKRQQVITNYFS